MNRLFVFFLALILVFCPAASFAQDDGKISPTGQVTYVEEGDPAPFSGTLYDINASASLAVKLSGNFDACQIEIDRAVGNNDVEWQLRYDQLDARYKVSTEVAEAKISTRDDIIVLQDEQLDKMKRPRSELIFAGGVIAGVGMTVLAGWAIGQAAGS